MVSTHFLPTRVAMERASQAGNLVPVIAPSEKGFGARTERKDPQSSVAQHMGQGIEMSRMIPGVGHDRCAHPVRCVPSSRSRIDTYWPGLEGARSLFLLRPELDWLENRVPGAHLMLRQYDLLVLSIVKALE